MTEGSEKWVLITGAGGGLGREFARIAAAEGYQLILTDKTQADLAEIAEEMRGKNIGIETITADLTNIDEVEQLWQKASQGRQIGALVNNAGLGSYGEFSAQENWARDLISMQVNILALTHLMKRAIPHMEQAGGGHILNVSSIASFTPGPKMAIYHASKAFVSFLSEAVASELKNSSVSITALCPPPLATNFFAAGDMTNVRLVKIGGTMQPKIAAKAGWRAAMKGRRIIIPSLLTKYMVFSQKLSPRRFSIAMTGWLWGKG